MTTHIGMIIFPGMTALDFGGPLEVFGRMPDTQVHVLAKSMDPVKTDLGFLQLPTLRLSEAPKLDLLFIGGGPGTTTLMEDAEVVDFLRTRAPDARWITSVCTGALVLGAAGLLRGYRASTHWAAMGVLPWFGATAVEERVVVDRNRITGGGVTAGIDFGLVVAGILRGEDVARKTQLVLEYDPAPPFQSGSPRTAAPELVQSVRDQLGAGTQARLATAERVATRNGWPRPAP
ncbi:MAG: DJ-1/PfpI family protein [Pseudomonadota bacterium]